MTIETTYMGKSGDMERLVKSVEANSEELAHLLPHKDRLDSIRGEAVELIKQQSALKASKQELSVKLRTVINEGQRVANALRSMLKEFYGLRSEKLAEFGIQPFRGRAFAKRNRGAAAPAPASETPNQNG